jgi:hypothetical protein
MSLWLKRLHLQQTNQIIQQNVFGQANFPYQLMAGFLRTCSKHPRLAPVSKFGCGGLWRALHTGVFGRSPHENKPRGSHHQVSGRDPQICRKT